jgi:hypothetical protein
MNQRINGHPAPDGDPLDTLLAQHTADTKHIPEIRRALTTVGIPLDAHEIGELIFCFEHTLGPRQPFRGFGENYATHHQVAGSLHAILMMTKAHHDDPWDD